MRIDRNLMKFAKHFEFYTHELGKMYIPTKDCPEDLKKAMDEYNSYTFPDQYKKSKARKHG